ncbi:MAG: DUF4367 domain-containing protein [Oscillospiraceae bacterium]|nr:DUF4367 domain-containing protein [Oscillospiraceae bacterium]
MKLKLTDEEIKRAALAYVDHRLKTLPPAWEGEFSPRFEASMAELILRTDRRRAVRRVLRSAVAAVLVLVLLGALTVLTVPEARAAFEGWIRNIIPGGFSYEFSGPGLESPSEYRLGWLPEGFKLTDEYIDDGYYDAYYETEDGEKTLEFSTGNVSEGTTLSVFDLEEEMKEEAINVGGFHGTLYISNSDNDINAVLFNADDTVFVMISTNEDKPVMLHIIDGIYLCSPTN